MERTSTNQPVRYRLTLHKPVSYGKHIILKLRLSLDSGIPGSLSEYRFSTRPLFRITAVGSGAATYPIASGGSVYTMEQAMDCGTGSAKIFLRFSDYLGDLNINQLKQMVRFTPSVRNLEHEVSGSTIWVKFDAHRDKPYQLRINYIPLKSSSSRTLSKFGDTSIYFFYRQAQPYLKWLQPQGILERFGPQVFLMQGRNIPQVDLRIYKINPLDFNFWPFPASPVVVDESKRPAGPGEEPVYGFKIREQIKLLGSPLISKVVPLPLKTGTGRRFGIPLRKHLATISGADQPGTYLVGYRPIGTSTQRHYIRMQVTDLCLSTIEDESAVVFVVTSLKTGAPVPGAEVIVHGLSDDEPEYYTLFKGVTDAAGMFHYKHKEEPERWKVIGRIHVKKNSDSLVFKR